LYPSAVEPLQLMETQALLQRLFQLHRFGIRPGLERIEALLSRLGNPHHRYPAIHVTGTNGKGSVCTMLAAALHAQGYRVGLYTSPHLQHFAERIRIDTRPVSDTEIAALLPWLLQEAEHIGATFFEVSTALAFALFAEHAIDIAVVEVGMGGRYDATNVVLPLVAVITSIDLDHQQWLGKTLEAIAWQKVGIVKPGCGAVIGERRPELRHLLCRWAGEAGARTVVFPCQELELLCASPELHQHLCLPSGMQVVLPLAGEHQRWNLALVLAVRELLAADFPFSDAALAEGLCRLRSWGLRARCELLQVHPPVLLDVAHNPAGIAALHRTLLEHGYGSTRWNVVFGAMADKDVATMLRFLHPLTRRLFACAPQTERALAVELLTEHARQEGFAHIVQASSVAEAVRQAWQLGEALLIVGSFYLLGEALPVVEELCRGSGQ